MTLRQRTSLLLTGVLFILSLSGGIFAAHATIGAVRSFQYESTLAKKGDVQTIGDWMTVPYISRVYHVPEPYLYRTLHMPPTPPSPHVTLHALALHTKRPVNLLIKNVQNAILTYRTSHPGPIHALKKGIHPVPGGKSS